MYAKCARLDKAYSVFDGMARRDVVSWNAMLQGLAMHGHGEKALQLFSRMNEEGFVPDKVTFISVLCACSHAGFVEEGLQYFYTMERDYGIIPEVEHYGCVIDLLGRGGRLKEAFRLVQSMPTESNAIIWGTLLGACRMHSAVDLAGEIVDHLVKLEPSDVGNFSMLSNIYAAAGDWDSVSNVRLHMRSIGIQKPSGSSSIEVDEEVHEFTVFDKSHPKSDEIYEMIDRLSTKIYPAVMCSLVTSLVISWSITEHAYNPDEEYAGVESQLRAHLESFLETARSFNMIYTKEIRPWTHMMEVPQLHGFGPAANRLLEAYKMLLKHKFGFG
ncbi:hypothetical protein CMV_027059 [Castanea mollissima]|uniref:Pentatricopeptide repeat-containing protein n=1 Tax=Castanea mollissima TaxID=60419 RepID=A0A8J4QKI8_9ROSI|nr:hypothetical protein CMV_027059 [Castanea mollissima]